MGRKKKNTQDDDEPRQARASQAEVASRPDDIVQKGYVDSSDEEPVERPHYDIASDIQELAYTFNIPEDLVQRLNDIMHAERTKTWGQDLDKLYEVLKEARSPVTMLRFKVEDMEKGIFTGKAKCEPQVRALARKHRLDKGAASKLEDAMGIREAMGKDVENDLMLLDQHLAASNKPSALVSQKLESLRKGHSVGHCIYSRECIVPTNGGLGIEGCFDKKSKRPQGFTDADLAKRFRDGEGGGGGKLMDEATIKRMMAAERQNDSKKRERSVDKKKKRRRESRSPSRSRRDRSRSRRSRSKRKDKDRGRR